MNNEAVTILPAGMKAMNEFSIVGKLHNFRLRLGVTKDAGATFISGSLMLATTPNSIVTVEVYATPLTRKGEPSKMFVTLLDIMKNYPTVYDRSDDDKQIAGMIKDAAIAAEVSAGLGKSPRVNGWETAATLYARGNFGMNVFIGRDGQEVVSTRKNAQLIGDAKDTTELKAEFDVHCRIQSVTETAKEGSFNVEAYTFNYTQTTLVPISLKVDVEGGGEYLTSVIGEVIQIQGEERSLVVETTSTAGGFGVRTNKEYDKGLFATVAELPIDIDEDAYSSAQAQFEILKEQAIAKAKAYNATRQASKPAAPVAAAAPSAVGSTPSAIAADLMNF